MSDRSPIIGSACVETPNGMGGIWHSVPLVKHIRAFDHHADEPCRAPAEDRLDDLCHPAERDISSDPVCPHCGMSLKDDAYRLTHPEYNRQMERAELTDYQRGYLDGLDNTPRDISSVTGSTVEYLLEDEDGAPFPDEFQVVAWQRIHDREREAVDAADNPEYDGTDAAHPAWWRGSDHGAKVGVDAFIRDELPGLLTNAMWGMDFADPNASRLGPVLAAKVAELRRENL